MRVKDTLFSVKPTFTSRGILHKIDDPMIMGILNLTPDSFYSGSRIETIDELLHKAERMIEEGAMILDLGACSTRPGSTPPTEKEEMQRLFPALKEIRRQFPDILLSVDTWRSEVAKGSVVDCGADIINDISAGSLDQHMFEVVAQCKAPYVLMHMQGSPATMQKDPVYKNVVTDLMSFFSLKIKQLNELGVNDIFIDPGFGFGKNLQHNYILMNNIDLFRMLGYPILVGISRKSMIQKLLGITADEALNGTTVLHTIALLHGASILRVHDVKPAIEAIRTVSYMQQAVADHD